VVRGYQADMAQGQLLGLHLTKKKGTRGILVNGWGESQTGGAFERLERLRNLLRWRSTSSSG